MTSQGDLEEVVATLSVAELSREPVSPTPDPFPEEPLQEQIANALQVLSAYARCFSIEEAMPWVEPGVDPGAVGSALAEDSRFIVLGQKSSEARLFVPEAALFRWFIHLTMRLAQAHEARLTGEQLARAISCLRMDGQWDAPPAEAVDFGQRFGFVAPAWTSSQYVFPLAHVLSFLSKYLRDAARSSLENLIRAGSSAKSLAARPLEEMIQESLSGLSQRQSYVVRAREGLLGGGIATLEQIGQSFGVSRERIRQIETKAWDRLRHYSWRNGQIFVGSLVRFISSRSGSLLVTTDSPDMPHIRFLAKCKGLLIPLMDVPGVGLVVLGALPEHVIFLEGTVRSESSGAPSLAEHLELEVGLCLSSLDMKTVCESLVLLHRPRATKAQKVYLALRAIGRPAHYSQVAREYNRLFPDDESTEHSIHAILGREKHGVVWVGVKGTYALAEWGYERPSKGLFDAVTEIVRNKYEETGRPVPFTVITAEIGRYRQVVNSSSLVFAAYFNPDLQRVSKDHFVPKSPDDQSEDDIPDEELDRIFREFEEKR